MAGRHDIDERDGSLARAVLALLDENGRSHWDVRCDDFWCYLAPAGHVSRRQGWKLHISATPLSVPAMLDRVAPSLIAHRCAFRFARTVERVEQLIAPWCEREHGGKILTAYPDDDEQFERLAEELHDLTEGLPGPPVLSDRPYRPGSPVHFRFGAFSAPRLLDDDGNYRPMLLAPDGECVPDRLLPWYSPPDWAVCPWPAPPSSGSGLLGGRYEVRGAIQHSYRGGVYRGTDVATREPVIIKHARPHVGADVTGQDARDRLRREGDLLDRLGPSGYVPRKRDIPDQSGHVFLVEDEVPGSSLRHWAEDRVRRGGEVTGLARSLVRLVKAVHDLGLGIRDLNPANVIVGPEESRLWLVDVEGMSADGAHLKFPGPAH